MKVRKLLHWLVAGVGIASLAVFVVLVAYHQPLDWALFGAVFSFGIAIFLSFAFTIGTCIHDVLDVEESPVETALAEWMSLVISLPNLLGSFFILCHLSVDVAILAADLMALAVLIAYFWPKLIQGHRKTPTRSKALPRALIQYSTSPRTAIPGLLCTQNVV